MKRIYYFVKMLTVQIVSSKYEQLLHICFYCIDAKSIGWKHQPHGISENKPCQNIFMAIKKGLRADIFLQIDDCNHRLYRQHDQYFYPNSKRHCPGHSRRLYTTANSQLRPIRIFDTVHDVVESEHFEWHCGDSQGTSGRWIAQYPGHRI